MIIFAFQPIIDLLVESTILNVSRKCKRRTYYPKKIVNGVEEHSPMCQLVFLDMYAGPEYLFFYKVANCNLMVFITLIFGSAYPILYFIALCSIGTQYLVERLSLTYFYRLPPKFNEKITI
jgi:hypothetical protein